ncbi:DUF58 domain-containing protein [Sphingobacteriaceae bacterium AH-315-L07]|nr:DUF58 domain-containing protein [Sphingobacteriaceae bacterium AH-315-L07]
METSELLRKVRYVEIKTRGLSQHIFSGEYHSVFKGRGMSFSEVREYQVGDEIRTIDWNVTARFNHPYVKIFEEERELTVMLVVDMSASGEFGTAKQLKKELITELCAVLAFSAINNNDKVGVIFFTDKIEKFIPPKKGRSHILRIIRELIDFKPDNRGTDIAEALRYLTSVLKKRCIAFVLSDFMGEDYENELKIAGKKHDLIGLNIYDEKERKLPPVGIMRLVDAESGKVMWVNSSTESFRNQFEAWNRDKDVALKNLFARSGVQYVNLRTDQSYVKPLMNFFRSRSKR